SGNGGSTSSSSGGAGGSEPTSSSSGEGGSAGGGGIGGGGGTNQGGGGAGQGGNGSGPVINGCSDARFPPPANSNNVTIASSGLTYTPKCLLISRNTRVTFNSDFVSHPLAAGEVHGTTTTPQPGNPIQATSTGTSVSVTFPTAGDYGYYCTY